ncbi:hypothetical protein GLOIN_2v1518195 [Rhizophagus irregularis DAOM 181602=DAOM 197198]|uniref:Uncharacterized protein n=1 Tax=Rhizophagus irregularis (strain DAOM 181602 / DAOM 197198 / MUCL 43194) TaxID=747089 RepID=A0A2P4QRX9_RHIID|nr:hypothetical protein GLOIN_2v1518195 [Rhizophagus irregularis DAOM 181602=DAOM 197198]POG80414.1 hypothetical protein GLOIN_2v1518195 [Rhizophagus irregularis DAOM 181602=DAOM 197198]|eukprot:XP_025187280.1 hypothetical protein GLOIN_2v1518195 [Rhizophagus irregularis DAOM 181602=DAOM 197198]
MFHIIITLIFLATLQIRQLTQLAITKNPPLLWIINLVLQLNTMILRPLHHITRRSITLHLMIFNSKITSHQLNIPGFKIIVIPNSVDLANLDLQNLFPQDSNPNIVTENLQTHSQNTFGLNDSFDFNNF